uniref:Uncharacterized protein n=1 Tax=Candidatus Kentrum sp. SD TaxID=2126332 RepID=A0A450Y987_9GAMM|nr:MAG: hypothetical protein BECKSD772F_GA0070984_102110 [Candidatus Kentron sp. SD]VFK42838.1 MAG: hypothetical protein BECKSD772E_GA0070983_102010 [Candidatus Kentron sp. SD]
MVCFRVVYHMGHGFRCRVRGDCIRADGVPIFVISVSNRVHRDLICIIRVQNYVNAVPTSVNRVQSCVHRVPNCVIAVQICFSGDRDSVHEVPNSDDGNQDGKRRLGPRVPDISGALFLGRFGFFLLFGLFETLAQLFGDGFEARRGFGGGFHIGVDLAGLLHGLAAHGDAGVVHLGGKGVDDGADVGERAEQIYVILEFGGAEIGGKDARMVLGG